ncbi:PAS domain-containing protein [Agrobacterium sp. a22-2]|uniref:PAS-domain containing protein n=1 Tax=Agrobacterium sp. a22-2 TaxID=2283840 RepID=UPI0014460301|nr:PAS-domain containing protein [Agrobacterium sp. a22-2]NKN35772.1 PAS domain-containing protein [Agrobacterium sp. a22-2]
MLSIACGKIEDLDLPAYVKDSELRYVAVNAAYSALFELPSEQFSGKTTDELFGRAEDAACSEMERRALVFGQEEQALCFDPFGPERYCVQLERFVTEDENIFLFAVFRDRPKKRGTAAGQRGARNKTAGRADSSLRPAPAATAGSSDLFRAVLEDLPVGTFVRDEQHRLVFANSAYVEIVGLKPDALIGKTEPESFPELGQRYQDDNRRILDSGETVELEDEFIRDGVEHTFITRGSRITLGGGERFVVGSLTEISRLKLREQQLLFARAQAESLHQDLESLLRSLPVGVLILNEQMIIEYANDAFRALLADADTLPLVGVSYKDLLIANHKRGYYRDRDLTPEDLFKERVAQFNGSDSNVISQTLTNTGRVLAISAKRLASGKILVTYSDITALHRREQETVLYRAAIEQLPVPVFLRDEERRLIFANAAYAQLLGGDREAFYGMCEDQMFPRNGQKLREENLHVLGTGEPLEKPQDIVMPDGQGISVITRLNRIVTPDSKRYLVGSMADVSLLKIRERELIAAQEKAEKLYSDLMATLRTMPVGVLILDENFTIEYANPKAMEIWEWPEGESLEGRLLTDLADAIRIKGWTLDQGSGFDVAIRERLEELRVLEGTTTRELIGPDGKQVLITSTRLLDHKVLITYSDFTEMRRREREISEARLQLERIGQLMQDATGAMAQGLVVVENGAIIMCNESMARIVDIPADILAPGNHWQDCFDYCAKRGDFGQDADAVLADWGDKVTKAESFVANFLANGRTWVQIEASVSERGHWVVLCTDITDLKRREEELTGLLSRAEAADKAKSEFLANMSHEIRTPMNGVLGMAELLAKSPLDTRQRTFVDIIVKSGNALLTIINDVLDFSKIDAGQMTLRKAPFDPVEAVEDVATLLSTPASDKDIELIVRGEATIRHMVMGDAGRFRQIATNLVGNAIKFTEKGHVLIDLSAAPLGSGKVMLTLRIKDTGIGIPEAKRLSIFEKFSQVDASSTRRHEGTGLGLAITAGLVDLFGGYVEVDSEVGQGSTFSVHLPLEMASERHRSTPLPINVKGSRILVVDDNAVNRQILTEQLAMWGFDGLAVDNGATALAILDEAARSKVKVDALIIDYHMPDMNGIDVARLVRADQRFDAISIIFLTSMDMVGDDRTFQALNVQAHLMKPARANLLRSAIVDVLRSARMRGNKATEMPPAELERRTHHFEDVAVERQSLQEKTADGQNLPQQVAAVRRCDVLVAEDNEVNQIVFTQILQAAGLSFRIVGNGREAVATWRRLHPALILMDVSMPVMNGHEAARAIREEELRAGDGRHVPIIGVTAHALESDRDSCLASGMDDYLSKPISPEALEEKMEQWRGKIKPERFEAGRSGA